MEVLVEVLGDRGEVLGDRGEVLGDLGRYWVTWGGTG